MSLDFETVLINPFKKRYWCPTPLYYKRRNETFLTENEYSLNF